MRNLVGDISRWVGIPLLVAGLIAWVFAPAFPQRIGEPPGGPSQFGTPAEPQVNPAAPGEIQDLKEQIQRLEDRERHNYLLVLEGERKTIDWWFSFLAVVTTLLAFFGVLIPFLMGRKDKEIIEEDKRQIRETKSQIETHKLEIERHKERIEEYASLSQSKYGVITNTHDEILKKVNTAKKLEASEAKKIKESVKAVQDDRASDPSRGLRAEAIAASQSGDVERANSLWRALATLQPEDALVRFNAGYWAQGLAKNSKSPESVFWERQAGKQYAEALRLKPDMHEAANNWGVALSNEARAVARHDLAEARRLWQQAAAKYTETLRLKPDEHAAANNLGNALLSEAGALPSQEGEQISLLLNRAEEVQLAHAGQAPGVVAYNLACVYGRRGDVARCVHWLKMCQTHGTLPDCTHLRTDRDLDAVRATPEFIEWLQAVCPE